MVIIDLQSPPAHALVEAIYDGDPVALRALLGENPALATARFASADPRSSEGTLLLVSADRPGRLSRCARTVALQVHAGGQDSLACTGPHASTALHWAASANDVDALDALLDAGADIEALGGVFYRGTPLADAVGFGQWQAARHLIDHGALSTLWKAAAVGLRSRILDFFPDRAYPDQEDVNTGFWYACYGGQFNAALFILNKGAELNWILPEENLTPLDAAHLSGAEDLVAWLHNRGARPATSPHGRYHQHHGAAGTLTCPYWDLHIVVVESGPDPYTSGKNSGGPGEGAPEPTRWENTPTMKNDTPPSGTHASIQHGNPQHADPQQGERLDLHNSHISQDAAGADCCGEIHLPTGRTCILRHRHHGGCQFV